MHFIQFIYQTNICTTYTYMYMYIYIYIYNNLYIVNTPTCFSAFASS